MPARLAACYFLSLAFVGSVAPYFSLYLHEAGSSAREIAILMAVMQSMRLLGPYLWVAVTGTGWSFRSAMALTTLGSLCGVLALTGAQGFGGLLVAMAILSVFWSGSLPLLEALTLSHVSNSLAAYGPIRMWGSAGFIGATLLLGQFVERYSSAVVPWFCLLLLLALLPISLILPNDARGKTSKPSALWLEIKAMLGRPAPVAILGAGFLMAAAHGAFNVFFSIHLAQSGYGGTAISILWAWGTISEMVVLMQMPRLLGLFSPRRLLSICFMAAIVRFAVTGWGVDSILLLVLAQTLHALSFGAHHAISVSLVNRYADSGNPTATQALHASIYGAGTLFGGLLSGGLWAVIGGEWTFGVSALLAVGGLAAILAGVRERGMDGRSASCG